jgi:flagellar biosynthetic protein FlhB
MVTGEGQERSEQPTQARREEARRQGQIPRSRDLAVAISLLAGFVGLYGSGDWLLGRTCDTTRALLGETTAGTGLTAEVVRDRFAVGCSLLLLAVLPVAAVSGGAVALSVALQTGGAVRGSLIAPDPSRLSPRRGLVRIFSLRGLGRGLFTVLKFVVVGGLAIWLLAGLADIVSSACLPGPGPHFGGSDTRTRVGFLWDETCLLGIKLSGALVLLGLLDYLHERWQHERDLRMTRAEVQEETLRLEGNREYKSRLRKEAGQLFSGSRKVGASGSKEEEAT